MKKLTTTVATLALLGSANYAVAQNQLETTLDLIVQGMMEDGSEVSYSERLIGNNGSVEYKDFVIAAPDGNMVVTTDWIKGTPSKGSDQDVTFTVADTISFNGTEGGETFSFEIQSDGFELTTNGLLRDAMNKDDITVNFEADSFIVQGGNPESAILRELMIDMGAIDFDLLVSEGDMYSEGSFEAEKFAAIMDYTMDGQTSSSDSTSEAFSLSFNFDIPAGEEDALGYLDGSKSAMFAMEAGASSGTSTMEIEGIEITMEGTDSGSDMLLEVADGVITFDVNAGETAYTITPGAGLPIPPVDISLSEIGMTMVIPAGAVEAPAEMVIELLLKDLIVGESLWSMIDPGKTISRDPAQIDINLEALVQVDALSAMAGAEPVEALTIHSLDVNQILVAVGGASIQADGAMTFNNDGPIPMPLGGVNINIAGLTTLANQLVALGLVDQMQAGMAMGMMMAFAKPGEGADTFVSEITFTENGIAANGQPIGR